MIDATYLPFTAEQLADHFTGNTAGHVAYFERSARRRRAHLGPDGSLPSLARSRRPRQMEKDERFWTVAALKGAFDRPDRTEIFVRMLSSAFGTVPPLKPLESWEECLHGDVLHLYFEAQIPSPPSYVRWLRENLADRHLIPHVLDAAGATTRRLEGATHVDALLLNPSNGFSVLIEAKVLSDISPTVSFDIFRNQLVRNIDVMLEPTAGQAPPLDRRDPDRSLFALLTPEAIRKRPASRLYGWLIGEYHGDADALPRDLPHRQGQDWRDVSQRLGWLTFEDIERAAPGVCRWMTQPADREADA